MNVKRFTARTSREALRQVREALGVDAVVLSTKPSGSGVEVLAMAPEAMQEVRQMAALPAAEARSELTLETTSVAEDVERMQMSTLSFQDYVRNRMLKKRRAALLQHPVAHVVLEGQRAHLHPLDVLGDAGRLQRELAAGLACRQGGHLADFLHRLGRHRQHLDAGARGLGREHDGVDAERLANLAKGFARCARGETFDVHAAAPMIEPIRMEWVSGISLCESTFNRGAARLRRRAIGARMRSGTSRQAGWPRSSWRLAESTARRVSVSAMPGSSAAPCGELSACVTMRSSSGSSAMTSSSLIGP